VTPIYYRNKAGKVAVSLDDGEHVLLPTGRLVERDSAWVETNDEPIVPPRGRHARVLRCGVVIEVEDGVLRLFHLASYWRVNPRPFDPSVSASVVTNLGQDAEPHRLAECEVPEVLGWLGSWAEHLRSMWGLERIDLHADFSLSAVPISAAVLATDLR
jgi:hypothetical protein